MRKIAFYLQSNVKSITHVNVAKDYFPRQYKNFRTSPDIYRNPASAKKEINQAGIDYLEFLMDIARRTLNNQNVESIVANNMTYFDIARNTKDIGHMQLLIPTITKKVQYNFFEIYVYKDGETIIEFYNAQTKNITKTIKHANEIEAFIKELLTKNQIK